MLSDTEKRAARLAVSRYGADRARVEETVRAVVRAKSLGLPENLLDALVRSGLLKPTQAQELCASLDATQFDPSSPLHAPRPPQPRPESAAGNGQELRYLGEYRILRRLGEGGMGAVYLGYQEADDCKVAIKVLADHLTSSQASIDRFYREAKSGALLNHPNIVHNIAVGQDRPTGKHYLVLEYVDGPSAHALLENHGHLPVGDAVYIALDVARALEHAHSRNVVHRDIKPGNILITATGIAKLADLGLAKRTDEASHLTATRQGFGTPYYMPYEQAMNARYADGRSDIYALGATLYHLVSGHVPFPGLNHLEILDKKNLGFFEPASTVNPEVPRALDEILDRMLARDPADRYPSARALIVDLERSGLAAAVPSFLDPELVRNDPALHERLASNAEATCPDLRSAEKGTTEHRPQARPGVWYLRYRDRQGQWCKAKATTQQILRRLRDGKLPGEVEAARAANGDFRPLGEFDEFRAAARQRGKTPRPPGSRRKRTAVKADQGEGALALAGRWWFLLGVGLVLALVGLVLVNLLGRT
jgi:serine/threonine-protein kinase